MRMASFFRMKRGEKFNFFPFILLLKDFFLYLNGKGLVVLCLKAFDKKLGICLKMFT